MAHRTPLAPSVDEVNILFKIYPDMEAYEDRTAAEKTSAKNGPRPMSSCTVAEAD